MVALGRSGYDSLSGLVEENGMHISAINLMAQNAANITSAAGPDIAYIISPAAAEQSFQNAVNASASSLQAVLDEYANPATRNQALSQVEGNL